MSNNPDHQPDALTSPAGTASEEISERCTGLSLPGASSVDADLTLHATPASEVSLDSGDGESRPIPDVRLGQSSWLATDKPEASVAPGPLSVSDQVPSSPSAAMGAGRSLAYFKASIIAVATGLSKKTIHRRATAEQWPWRSNKNHIEYQPPADIAARCTQPASSSELPLRVKFADLHDPDSRARTIARVKIVERFHAARAARLPIETSLRVAAHFANQHLGMEASSRTVRRWTELHQQYGIDGLVEQRVGIVGPKSCVDKLTPEQREEISTRGKALAIDHGLKHQKINVARAARELAADPNLPAPLRETLHGGHSSKSYVPPSVRALISPAPLTAALSQGTRHARLSSRFTPCHYDDVRPGQVYVADDMTDNCLCWVDWPNPMGFRLCQAQLLAVMDVSSLRWLNFRLIIRLSGQYNSDDIWGLFGDVFDDFGLPEIFLLEGGHWQSNKVKGQNTGLNDDERLGGLEALGVKISRAYGPQAKGMLEGAFNTLQVEADAAPGYIGREQRYDEQERIDRLRKLCENGTLPVREHFHHISQRADFYQQCMARLNATRNDGKILRGQTPMEKWAAQATTPRVLAPECKWLYRSQVSVVQVTRNGLRITQGSGQNQRTYYYDNPELLVPRQKQKVAVYWNDRNPSADAVVLATQPKRKYIGVAQYVPELSRFTATDEQLSAEAQRKKAALGFARSELRSIQPELKRAAKPIPYDTTARDIGEKIQAAENRADQLDRTRAQVRHAIASVSSLANSRQETIVTPPDTNAPRVLTDQDVAQLLSDDP